MGLGSNVKTKMVPESRSAPEPEADSKAESESESDCLIEDKHWKNVKAGQKRKYRTRKNGQLRPSTFQKSNQKKPTKKPTIICESLKKRVRDSPHIPVTCGDKEGVLDLKKFRNGEPCIFSEGRLFAPQQFERFGGMERCKKWKTSIFHSRFRLQTLIERSILPSPSFKRSRRTRDRKPRCRRKLFAPRTSPATIGLTVKDDVDDSSSDISSSEEDEDEDHADPAQSQDNSFPVICSAGTGTLHLNRFATGKRGKCIRTEDSWKTPEEFLYENMNNGNWKRDIISHGTCLGILIQQRVLEPHAVNCPCNTCRGVNERDQDNDDWCFECKEEGKLVCCERCPRAFHHHCHVPPLQDSTLGDEWICSSCTEATTPNRANKPSTDQSHSLPCCSPHSHNT